MIRRLATPLSRHGTALAWMLVLGSGAKSLAQTSETSTSDGETPQVEATPSEAPSGGLRLGAMLDVGAPDGVGVSAVVRPIEWLRLNAGLTTNTLSVGVRGGISLVPLSTFIAPSLNADVGHYFDANYNELVDRLGGIPLRTQVPIDEVGFNYVGASVGLEIGKPERFSFFLRAGLTHGSLTIDDAEALLQDVTGDPDLTAKPLTIRFTSPSIKLGFLLYFF
ncbi:autotransporter outer membrane beta-barrel domain-containing protein [Hyalangium rubrum]|uniref:Autotransporter outer membrane beta-barrel domain-containing protein n=1 Tax=Hyalangium rubrum TaxID=3103134 RepID=A0ABU5H1D9_9BACT|nr:autotransporter outer membrane beta-barrel domain-containing protein [Hyalangium sp. s54d21]MDY7227268.1 autotransporter outer membrane beta-barrel domain-containing protein [Hyalangium sp. s54d21]